MLVIAAHGVVHDWVCNQGESDLAYDLHCMIRRLINSFAVRPQDLNVMPESSAQDTK